MKRYQIVIRNNFISILAVFQVSAFYFNNDFCNRLVSICPYPGLLTPRVSLVSSTSRSQHTLCWWQSVPHINYTNIDIPRAKLKFGQKIHHYTVNLVYHSICRIHIILHHFRCISGLFCESSSWLFGFERRNCMSYISLPLF